MTLYAHALSPVFSEKGLNVVTGFAIMLLVVAIKMKFNFTIYLHVCVSYVPISAFGIHLIYKGCYKVSRKI